MALNLKLPNLFPHSRSVKTGGGKERIGQGTIIVSLDGTGDFDDIQEAINALPNSGGEIFMKEGTYHLKSSIILKENISLIGIGRGAIIIPDTGSYTNNSIITATSKDNLMLKNFKILVGGGPSLSIHLITCSNFIIENIIETGAGEMRITGGANNLINKCDYGNGLELRGTINDLFITNNILGLIDGGATALDNLNIMNNVINDSFILSNTTNSQINGNSINNDFEIFSSSNITASNNSISRADGLGIFLSSTNNSSVTGNAITGAGIDGIRLSNSDNNVISSNSCFNNNTYGINILNNTCDKNIIIGNVCLSNGTGAINDAGTNTHPNGASGTNNLALDDLNIIA